MKKYFIIILAFICIIFGLFIKFDNTSIHFLEVESEEVSFLTGKVIEPGKILENTTENNSFFSNTLSLLDTGNILEEKEVFHIKTPEKVQSLYYTAYGITSESRINNFYEIIKTGEVNSVTIDIKEVDGYISFEMPDYDFKTIKPKSNNIIKDISSIIEGFHENNIYVIGRIVVFKDNLLTKTRPDLSIKWNYDTSLNWEDYKGNSYLDPGSKEVWDYYVDLASASYELGFDEINFDYIRFPSDGYVSKSYYPYSQQIINDNGKWGKITVIDKFGVYITEKLREKYPDIVLSADVFGLVTNVDLFNIGQNLEVFLLNFDYVSPMIYPSHYGVGYLGNSVPDNIPYEIFNDSIIKSEKRINDLNNSIEQYAFSGTTIMISGIYTPELEQGKIYKVYKNQLRPWLQGFSCSRCKGATSYTRDKFRKQINSLNDNGLDSWFVWSSSSSYYKDWYGKK